MARAPALGRAGFSLRGAGRCRGCCVLICLRASLDHWQSGAHESDAGSGARALPDREWDRDRGVLSGKFSGERGVGV